jgi:peptidoglycan/xylan/chitin deacetylase (PgdA/CDA1 family)
VTKYVIIRDDDPNYFTPTSALEGVYDKIFSLNIPISACVIPNVQANLKLDNAVFHGAILDHEPFIPPKFRGTNQEYNVSENPELVEYLKKHKDQMSIIQHGFSHSFHEFASSNYGEVEKKLKEGNQILQRALGEAPLFFSAPYDLYSPTSLRALRQHFKGATCGEIKLRTMISTKTGIRLPLDMVPSFVNASRKKEVFYFHNDFLMLGYHNIMQLSPFDEYSIEDFETYINQHNVIVISLHYWEFYYDKNRNILGNSLNTRAIKTLIDKLQRLQEIGAQFLTISQFYDKLNKSGNFS